MAEKESVVVNYLRWHYVSVPKAIGQCSLNFLRFLYYYFSIGFLLRTLFAPWKKQLVSRRSPGFDLGEYFQVITFNLISRLIGAGARTTLIFCWLTSIILSFIAGLLVFIVWAFLPGLTLPLYLIAQKGKQEQRWLLIEEPFDVQKMLNSLLDTGLGQFVFSRLDLPPEKIKNLQISSAEKDRFKTGLAGFMQKAKIQNGQINPKDFLEFLSKEFTPFIQLLAERKIKKSEVITVCHWYLREEKMTAKPFALSKFETLLKIPPLGKTLIYAYTPNLDRYCLDLSQPAAHSHHLVGRKRETGQIEQILSRSGGNNVLLVGDPGVGRHTIIEAFAKRVHEGETDPALSHKRVMEFGIRRLLSETKSLNEAKGLLEETMTEAAYAGNVILVIENFDQYVSLGPGREDLTNIFAKAVLTGVQVIGVTTYTDFAKYLYPNQELLKHFEKVEASPPTNQEALVILQDTVGLYEQRNRVFVTFRALKEVIDKVDKYIVHIPFPEKAIDLLDEACVYASQNQKIIITPEIINRVISEKTKIPLGKISQDEAEKLKNLEELIHQRVIDQEEAVVAIAKAMRRARVGITRSDRPIGSFLFMGPTGVGKTETAKALAEGYFGDPERMIRFDMSEYQGEDALDRVIGSLSGNEPGLFAKKIRENPFSLLLLDEIEKSNRNILNLYLTMIDEGYFTDAFGKKVDCRSLIIIGTSNAGTELIRQRISQEQLHTGATPQTEFLLRSVRMDSSDGGTTEKQKTVSSLDMDVTDLEKEVIDYVQKQGIFSPEFINRFDAVVIYKPLTREHLVKIARLMLKKLNKRLKAKDISVKVTDNLVARVVELGYDPAFGARPMNRVIQDKIEDQIAQKILRGELKKGQEIEIEI